MKLGTYLGGLALSAAVISASPPPSPLEHIAAQPPTTSAPVCYNYSPQQKSPFERYEVKHITEWNADHALRCIAKNFDIDTKRDESSILYHLGQAAKIAAVDLGMNVANEPTHFDIAGIIDCRGVAGSTKAHPLTSDIVKYLFMYGGADRYLYLSPDAQKKLAPNYPRKSHAGSGPNYLADILLAAHYGLSNEAVDFLKGKKDFGDNKKIAVSEDGRTYTETCADGKTYTITLLEEDSEQAGHLKRGDFGKLLPTNTKAGVFEVPRIRE